MITQSQQTILSLIAAALFDPSIEIPQTADWAEVRREAQMHTVQFVSLSVAEKYLPEKEKLPWRNMADYATINNMRVAYEHSELDTLMREHRIPYVILKGLSSASYYKQPDLRSLGDLDFLVAEENTNQAGKILEENGFKPEEDKDGFHIAYNRAPSSTWELHRGVGGIPGGAAGMRCRGYMADVIETAVEANILGMTCRIPDTFHHGMILLLHTASHLTSEGIGLRHLCDWAVFYAGLSHKEFRDLFEERLKACGLWKFACLLTLTSVKYLHAPMHEWAGKADEVLLESIITDILNGGNFGMKDIDRYCQIKYISNRGEHTVDGKSVFSQVIDTIERKAKDEKKSKTKVLLEYMDLMARGERKQDTLTTLKEAGKRKNIYKEFHLFEI